MKNHFILLFLLFILTAATTASSQNLDWIFSCGGQAHPEYFKDIENLNQSGVSTQAINAELRTRLPGQLLGSNYECLYDVILRYGDDSILEILKNRMKDNAKPIKISEAYLASLAKDEIVPQFVLNKLKTMKGKAYPDLASYDKALQRILNQHDYASYGNDILYAGRLDPENYSADLYHLLISRNVKFADKDAMVNEMLILKHTVSYEYFLNLHLQELDIASQLYVLLYVVKNVFKNHPTFGYYAANRLDNMYKTNASEYLSFVNTNKDELPVVFTCVIDKTCP